jgi:hypothetical protein
MRLLQVAALAGLLALAAPALPSSADEGQGKVEVGKPAPPIDLPATNIDKVLPNKKGARTISLDDFKGKKNVVVYFFPKALTRG